MYIYIYIYICRYRPRGSEDDVVICCSLRTAVCKAGAPLIAMLLISKILCDVLLPSMTFISMIFIAMIFIGMICTWPLAKALGSVLTAILHTKIPQAKIL